MIEQSLDISIVSWILISASISIAIVAASHAAIYKRNNHSAFVWVGLILLSPLIVAAIYFTFGWFAILVVFPIFWALFYFFFGINRLPQRLRKKYLVDQKQTFQHSTSKTINAKKALGLKWVGTIKTGDNLGYSPFENADIDILDTGANAYPEMLDAINKANRSVSLFSYIFRFDKTGKKFIDALAQAHKRGVEVRVLLDAVGSRKKLKTIIASLKKQGISAQAYSPVVLVKSRYPFLRNHRKLLIIDGEIAFTGGLNIEQLYWADKNNPTAMADLHFKFRGNIANYLQEVFVSDWLLSSGEALEGEPWFSRHRSSPSTNNSLTRVITTGPCFEEERLRWHFWSAINSAEKSIRIMTPYFLPDYGILSALCSASIRGVNIEILVPQKSDHKLIDWALKGSVSQLLELGCHISFKQGYFDHSKLLVIDDNYVSIGSANWDARSLRLNYELNVECFGEDFATQLISLFERKKQGSKALTMEYLNNRSIWLKLRDGIARMFSPYL